MIWSPQGNYLAFVVEDEFAQIWRTNTRPGEHRMTERYVSYVFWSPDENTVLLQRDNELFDFVDLETGRYRLTLQEMKFRSWSPDSQLVQFQHDDHSGYVWDIAGGNAIWRVGGEAVLWGAESDFLIDPSYGAVRVWTR